MTKKHDYLNFMYKENLCFQKKKLLYNYNFRFIKNNKLFSISTKNVYNFLMISCQLKT